MDVKLLEARVRHYLNTSGPHTLREIASYLAIGMEPANNILWEMSLNGEVFYGATSGLWKARNHE